MKILSVSLENFASYKHLEFSFEKQGLTLINGPTGSGKSTLCDAIPWILFGRTAKDGAVDEVLSWPGNSVTEGRIALDNGMIVTRIRGSKAKDNDLYWVEITSTGYSDGSQKRGKDIPDTQRLINLKLGITTNSYLAAAYYHETSQTAQFFTTNASNRRLLCEQIVDLRLTKHLQLSISELINNAKKSKLSLVVKINQLVITSDHWQQQLGQDTKRNRTWEIARSAKIIALKKESSQFKQNKENTLKDLTKCFHDHEANAANQLLTYDKELLELQLKYKEDSFFNKKEDAILDSLQLLGHEVCSECGTSIEHKRFSELEQLLIRIRNDRALNKTVLKEMLNIKRSIEQLKSDKNPFRQQIKDVTQSKNTYLNQIKALRAEINPFLESIKDAESKGLLNATGLSAARLQLYNITQELGDLELLSGIVADLRSHLVKNTIIGLETQTNALLADHFDAEIRVAFESQDADKIDVSITKDGNQCVFTQLSKGQRQLLKLSFGVAVMKQVANHNGMSLNAVFFDEATDGLDESMKVKAFKLLKSLESDYDSIFLVDHSPDLKAMVDNQYIVSLINGGSHIEKA